MKMLRNSSCLLLLVFFLLPSQAAAQDSFDYAGSPRLATHLPTAAEIRAVFASDPFAFLVYQESSPLAGPAVLDISDPLNPVLLGDLPTPISNIQDMAFANYMGYIAAEEYFYVVSTFPTTMPQVLSWIETPGTALAVALSGNHAYVADQTGLTVIDISLPGTPGVLATLPLAGCTDVAVQGDFAYLGGDDFRIVDISDPTAPILIQQFGNDQQVYAVFSEGNVAYFTDPDGLTVLDVSDPADPVILSFLDFPIPLYGEFAYCDYKIQNGHALFLTWGMTWDGESWNYYNGYCWLFDLTDPQAPSLVGRLSLPRPGLGGGILGDLGYLACSDGLRILSGATSGSPQIGADDSFGSLCEGLAFAEDKIYMAGSRNGLGIFDVSDAAQPHLLGSLATPNAQAVAAADGYAYVADDGGLLVVDARDPTEPQLAAQIGSAGSYFQGVALNGSFAYAISLELGLLVVDVSDPENPVTVGSLPALICDCLASCGSLVLGGHQLSGGFWVVDAGDPSAPAVLGGIPSLFPASMCPVGDLVYLQDKNDGLVIVDVSDPEFPEIVANPGWDLAIAGPVDGRYAYGVNFTGVSVLDVCDPTAPEMVGTWIVEQGSSSAVVANSLLFGHRWDPYWLPYENRGLAIFLPQTPSAVPVNWDPDAVLEKAGGSVDIHPNPFNPRTVVDFRVDKPAPVKIAVYDVAGRRVRILEDRFYQAGSYSVEWEGASDVGRSLPSGTYLLRLQIGDEIRNCKISLVR